MRKFAFLLAIVAVFAMSACAYAAPAKAKVEALTTAASPSDQNNGAVTGTVASKDLTTTVYYFGDITSLNGKLGMKVTTANVGAKTNNLYFGGFLNGETWKAYTETATENQAYNADANFETVSLKDLKVISGIAVYDLTSNPTALADDGVALSVDLKDVAITVSADAFVELVDGANQTFALKGDGYYLALTDPTDIEISTDVALPAGIHAVVSGDTIVVSADKTAKVGKCVVEVKVADAGNVTVSEDKGIADVVIAGLQDNDVVMKVAIEVVPNQVTEIIDAISKDANLADGVNIVVDDKVVTASDDIIISEDLGGYVMLNIVSLDKVTLIPSVILQADADKVVIAQGAEHHEPEASVKPTSSTVVNDYVLSVEITASDIEKLRELVAMGEVFDEYEFHLHALGQVRTLVYESMQEVPDSSSSSGACSMGFGLAAIAGLAALALRKRSK